MIESLFLTHAEIQKIKVYKDWLEDPGKPVTDRTESSSMTRSTYNRRIQEVKQDLRDFFEWHCVSPFEPPTVQEYGNKLIIHSFPFRLMLGALNENIPDMSTFLAKNNMVRSTMYRKMHPLFTIMNYLGLRLSFENGVTIIGPEITIRLFYITLLSKIASKDVAKAIELETFNWKAHQQIKTVMRMDENLFETMSFEIGYRMVMKRYENEHFFTPTAELLNFYEACLNDRPIHCTEFLADKGKRRDEAVYFYWISEFFRYRKGVIYERMDFDTFFDLKGKQSKLHARYHEVMRIERQFARTLMKNKAIQENYSFTEFSIRENLKLFFTLVYLFGDEMTVNSASFDYLLRGVRDGEEINDAVEEFVTLQSEEISRIFGVSADSFGRRLTRVLAHYLEPYEKKAKNIYFVGLDITPSHPLTVRVAMLLRNEKNLVFEQRKENKEYDLVVSYSSRLENTQPEQRVLNLFGREKQMEKHLVRALAHMRED